MGGDSCSVLSDHTESVITDTPHYVVIGGWVRPLSDSDWLLMHFHLVFLKLSSVSDLAPVESYLGTRVLPVLSFYQYSTFEMLA